MRNAIAMLPVAIVFGSFTQPAVAADPLPRFSRLQKNDVLVVLYHSQGCFGSTSYEFTFRKDACVSVSVASLRPERKELGQLLLTSSELTGLDRLLDLYRKGQPGISTTTESLSITLLQNGKAIRIEQLTDDSGFSLQTKGLATFPEIARRLQSKS